MFHAWIRVSFVPKDIADVLTWQLSNNDRESWVAINKLLHCIFKNKLTVSCIESSEYNENFIKISWRNLGKQTA